MTAERRAPVEAGRFAGLPDAVQVRTEPFVAQCTVRAAADAAGAPAAGRGRWSEDSGTTVIRLGPDEWLVTDPFVTPDALVARLRAQVDGVVVDTSAQRTTFRLRGTHARDVLSSGCALDLDPSVFGPGSAAQTVVGRAGVVLLAEDDGFVLLVRSSFADYLADWLVDAAAEYV